MFAERGVEIPEHARVPAHGGDRRDRPRGGRRPARAAGGQRPHRDPRRRRRVQRRRRRLAARPELGLAPGPVRESTVIWIVEHARPLVRDADRGRHAGQDRPQQRGPRRLPEPPAPRSEDGGEVTGTPIHVLLRQVLEELRDRRGGDRAARPTRRSPPPRRSPSPRRATSRTSSSRPAARTSCAARPAPTPTTSSSRRRAGRDTIRRDLRRPRVQRLETVAAPAAARRPALPRRPPQGRLPPRRRQRAVGRSDRSPSRRWS